MGMGGMELWMEDLSLCTHSRLLLPVLYCYPFRKAVNQN
jgi:hypothetical protein